MFHHKEISSELLNQEKKKYKKEFIPSSTIEIIFLKFNKVHLISHLSMITLNLNQ